MPLNILETSDVSSLASDFQEDGTAAPGVTGRLADAGHVHPAIQTQVGYQVVTQDYSIESNNTGQEVTIVGPFTVTAPTGMKITGASYRTYSGNTWAAGFDGAAQVWNAPSADGSQWLFYGDLLVSPSAPAVGTVILTLYATCVSA